jgi:hypothetical protein
METSLPHSRRRAIELATRHRSQWRVKCGGEPKQHFSNAQQGDRASRDTLLQHHALSPRALHALLTITAPNEANMEIRVSYEHSLAIAPEEYIVHVPSQLVTDVPANVPRALLPEFIANLIVERSPSIGKIRNLRIL